MTKNDRALAGRKVVIAGGSGFLGISLAHRLANSGAEIVILARNSPRPHGPWRHVLWDARSLAEWQRELEGAAGLINLVGRSVDCIKTPDHQDEILRSRVEATRVLGTGMRMVNSPPPVWVQMSTAHIYGDPPEVVCTEDSPTGLGLAPAVGKACEAEFIQAVLPSQRPVVLRTSFVIGRDRGAGGGALDRLKGLARLGLAGRVGSGQQGMSWLHEADFQEICLRSLLDGSMTGVYIASTPNPVPQREFMKELRRAVGVPFGLPASEWMVRIGAHWFLRTDPELVLFGRYVMPARLVTEGFTFAFPRLREALRDLLA